MARKRQQPSISLADQLRAAIAASGLTEYELAQRAEVDQGSLSRFMRGERDWTLHTAGKVAGVLGLWRAAGPGRSTIRRPIAVAIEEEEAPEKPEVCSALAAADSEALAMGNARTDR